MRLEPADLDKIDAWRGAQPGLPSRSEAVRRLLASALTPPDRTVQFSDGEKLIAWILCDLLEALKAKSEIDPNFVRSAIIGGHFWALDWKYGGIFGACPVGKPVVSEVVDILDMWRFVETGAAKLSKIQRRGVVADAGLYGDESFAFIGFDRQNDEGTHMSVAQFFVDNLDTFSFLKDRNLEAHCATLDSHRRMLTVFDAIRKNLVGRELNVAELTAIMKASMV
jgi:uncharacterized protein YfbU (UPF0304 family)